jgi:hypothetical protein
MNIPQICSEILEFHEAQIFCSSNSSTPLRFVTKLQASFNKKRISLKSLNLIFETYLKIATDKTHTKGKQVFEAELLPFIVFLPHTLWGKEAPGCEIEHIKIELNKNNQQIVSRLKKFAVTIYELKMPRDAFGGKRKGYSIKLLKNLSYYLELPEFLNYCLLSLKSKNKTEFIKAVESLEDAYLDVNLQIDQKIIDDIEKRISKTKHREEIRVALNFMINIGLRSYEDAKNEIETWDIQKHLKMNK